MDSVPPLYKSSYLMGQFVLDLYLLEESILLNQKADIQRNRKKAFQSGMHAFKNSKKYASDRTEVFRLMGLFYWLIGRQNKAVHWWMGSIKEGERLGARVELARTHMEMGSRLLEGKSTFREQGHMKPEEYLERARKSFEAMDLEWDLEGLDKIISYGRSP